jgi:hypothetical protein
MQLAGGGIKRGLILGTSDCIASYPMNRPIGPEELAASNDHARGITDLSAQTGEGRPIHLLEFGEPMRELSSQAGGW